MGAVIFEEMMSARRAWEERAGGKDTEAYRSLLNYIEQSLPDFPWAAPGLPALSERSDYIDCPERFRARDAGDSSYRLESSGTTGDPLSVHVDLGTWYGLNVHFFEQIRKVSGLSRSRFRSGEPGVVFVSDKPGRAGFVRPLPALSNALYVRLPLGSDRARVMSLFSRLRAPILYGKSSYLLQLRALLGGGGRARSPWSPDILLVSGERLYPDDKDRLVRFFGAPIVNAYASTEGGLIAASRPDSDPLHIVAENARLEILGDDGKIGPSGSGEIVLTNLMYRGTVFARYRTGDHGTLATDPVTSMQRLTRLTARDPEELAFASVRLPTAAVMARLREIKGLLDYQVQAHASGRSSIHWTADPDGPARSAVAAEISLAWAELLPEERVDLLFAERLTPAGGKKRRFVQIDDPPRTADAARRVSAEQPA